MSDVFISYSSKDEEIANSMVDFLESRGISCWIAPRNIVPGSDWAASISTAITASKIFLVIYSENSANSEQCPREISLAEATKGITVIPYKADDAELKGVYQYYLTGAHWITAKLKNNDYKYEELYSFICGILGKNIQNINANTYIDHLHIESGKDLPESISEAIENQGFRKNTGTAQDGIVKSGLKDSFEPEDKVSNATDKKSKKRKISLLLGISGAAMGLIAIILVIVNIGNKEKTSSDTSTTDMKTQNQVMDKDIPSETPTTEPSETEHPVTETPVTEAPITESPKEEALPTEALPTEAVPTEYIKQTGEKKNISLKLINKDCRVDYIGEFNEVGQPDGEGEYRGIYYLDEKPVQVSYKGIFINGVASGKGISTEIYEDGHTREYEGFFADNTWNGEAKLTLTYLEGNISKKIYEGVWSSGKLAGTIIETRYFMNGDVQKYEGYIENDKWIGKGVAEYTYSVGNIEKQIIEGEWVDNGFTGSDNRVINYFHDGSREEYIGEYYNGKNVFTTKTTYDVSGNVVSTVLTIGKPYNISAEDIEAETARIVWNSSDRVTSFQLEVYSDSEMKEKKGEKNVSGKSIKLSGLKNNTTYYVRIRAEYIYEGESLFSDWTNITIKTIEKDEEVSKKVEIFDYQFKVFGSCTGIYSGEVNDEGLPNGEGVFNGSYIWDDKLIQVSFKGSFENGIVSGKGVSIETYEDGHKRIYDGLFADNNWNGEAILTLTYKSGEPQKVTYESVWKNGRQNIVGKKTSLYTNGDIKVYEGEFNNGVYEGTGKLTITFANDERDYSIHEGTWKNNVFEGENNIITTYFKNGEKIISTGQFINGDFSGKTNKVSHYYPDGELMVTEGEFLEGTCISGTVTVYNSDGSVKSEEKI